MSNKKILFIGDTSTACNYGSIAVSETYKNLLQIQKYELTIIDYRSIHYITPPNGFPVSSEEYINSILYGKKNKVKNILDKLGLLHQILKVKKALTPNKKHSDNIVPTRFEDYKLFTKEVLKGNYLQFEYQQIKTSDIVVINGEGSIVNGTDSKGLYNPGGRYILYMAYLAKSLNKKCLILNHTVDPQNRDAWEMIKNIYPTLDKVMVRERLSKQKIKEIIGSNLNVEFTPDILFAYEEKLNENFQKKFSDLIDFSKPYICLGDSSGIKSGLTSVKWDIKRTYFKLIDKLKNEVCPQIVFIDGYRGSNKEINYITKKLKLPTVNLVNCNYNELYQILKGANIFLSGRWHASILSLLAETPILLWGSDSHKTEGLYELIDYPYRFFDVKSLPNNIDLICNETKKILNANHNNTWKKVSNYKPLALKNVSIINEYLS